MARLDPLRDRLVDDDEAVPGPVITQCEGMRLALDPTGQIIGRVYDPLLRQMRRQRLGNGTCQITVAEPNPAPYLVSIRADKSSLPAADPTSYAIAATAGTFGSTGTNSSSGASTANDGVHVVDDWSGPAGTVFTLTITFSDTSNAADTYTWRA